MSSADREHELEERCKQLEAEVATLRKHAGLWPASGPTVRAPDSMKGLFEQAQEIVASYFSDVTTDPTQATIEISGQRYVLMRASSLSVDFLRTINNLYADQGEHEAMAIGRSFLFDISHVLGMEDARNFHEKMGLTDPIARLSTGPVHFAYSGWAFVDIDDVSSPSPDENYFIKYDHPFSFEADSWLKAGQQSEHPVCIMNAGYSSGWCEQSFGVDLTAVEITCKAAGDDRCTFIMAPPHRIREYLEKFMPEHRQHPVSYQIPTFFERKRVEEEMKTARKKAEESDRMKSEFLTNMSHEIRTPMNALIGMTELVLDTALSGTQREHLNTVLESAESLMDIINQILDFSKIESGTMELDESQFSLRQCIADTIRPLEVRAEDKGIKLNWQVAEEVPEILHGDAMRLRQILVNLIGNAIKFTSQGGVTTVVAVEQPTSRGLMLHFAVRDTGIGIPSDKLDAIFDAFTQVDMSTTKQYGGTGLGLTISASLVELLGGNIWVENNSDLPGCTFHFTTQFGVETSPTHPELVDQSVLLVADNPRHRKVLAEALSKLGMKVATAESGHDALSMLGNRSGHADQKQLVLTDLGDSVVLVEMIRGRPELKDTDIIALVGKDEDDLRRLKELGVKRCLVKPLKQSALIAAIRAATAAYARPVLAESATSAAETAEPPPAAPGIHILLVEDGLANQKFALAMLNRWGHTVAIANNGR
ncbi:MAG: ATP-binding protein, partial [Pirellulaceae bacterium]